MSALLESFVTSRPLSGERSGLGGVGRADAPRAEVTVDDAALFMARFDGGAIGSFEQVLAAVETSAGNGSAWAPV